MVPLTQIQKIQKDIEVQFLADIIFGRPSKDCVNFGICRIDPVGKVQPIRNCNGASAQAIVTLFGENHLELDFLRSSIDFAVYLKFFSKETFLIKETFLHNYDNYNLFIKAGNYPIEENNSLIKVIFQAFN